MISMALPGRISVSPSVARIGIAHLDAQRGQDVAPVAVLVLDQGDARRAVGVVLDGLDDAGDVQLVAAEIDDAVLALVAAAVVADGDAPHVVAAAALVQRHQELAVGLVGRQLIEGVAGAAAQARRHRVVCFDAH